ncbi:hypothetical protein DEJ30_15120 [Curtobacterium sp. MCPF17_003]|uniref:GPP34 family phosphoprotein n=1 Tax=Curtobacterium sp. MCPF17_003 TaxID=2175637 RepID=UPI000D8837A8|nr:hypothetical protein DEJ30_15120 [Curtobacterium sp. MCPF17_003]
MTNYPEQHGRPEAALRSGFADVLAGWAEPTPSAAAVIGLLDATGILRKQFGAVDRAIVEEITTGSWASPAVKAVLEEIQATATVAIRAANTASTTAAVSSRSAERSAQRAGDPRPGTPSRSARGCPRTPTVPRAVRPVAAQHCRRRGQVLQRPDARDHDGGRTQTRPIETTCGDPAPSQSTARPQLPNRASAYSSLPHEVGGACAHLTVASERSSR